MQQLEGVLKLLTFWNRRDITRLLSRARLEFDESSTYGSLLFSRLTRAVIYAPIDDCERLRSLGEPDRNQILRALLEIYPPRSHDVEINGIDFLVDPSQPTVNTLTDEELIKEIEAQQYSMIAVATGGPRIQSVGQEYKDRRQRIGAALGERGLEDPNPYSDLWAWYAKWSSGDLPTYRSRRQFISDLYGSLIDRVKRGPQAATAGVFEEPTGWMKVDRGLGETRKRLEEASTEEQFQAIGLLCRETLISLAQVVYDPARHEPVDGVEASQTDAKRMIDSYLSNEMMGSTNEVARRHAKAALDLANDLQHRRTATFRQAALCAEATTSVVNIIAIVSGQRDP